MTDIVDPDSLAYAEQYTTPLDGELAELAGWTRTHTASPGMMSGLAEARLLQALIAASGARRVLEIGTFTALGTLAMAAALADGGQITTLEVDPDTAATARRHIAASPHAARVKLIEGDALKSLAELDGPFDVVYIDARKSEYPAYYEAVVPKLAPSGVLVADNLYRAGRALDPSAADEDTRGIREFARLVQADTRTDNVLLTVGDGLMLAWRRPPGA